MTHRYSSGARKLLDLAQELGFEIHKHSCRGGHTQLKHAKTLQVATIPNQISDRSRNYFNYRSHLRQSACRYRGGRR